MSVDERKLHEFIGKAVNDLAGGYVDYDPETQTFCLSPEQEFMLANEESPVRLNHLRLVT